MIRPSTLIGVKRWYTNHDNSQYGRAGADTYDTAAKILTRREEFAADLMNRMGESGRTLEIAAGTGLVSQAIQEHTQGGTYVDREASVLKTLQERLLGRAAIVQADFFNLPFADKSFDTVIGVGAYRYVPPERKEEFWDEMHRVTSPEARIFIAQFYPRLFRLQGSDINNDKGVPHFSLRDVRSVKVKLNLGPLAIRSGEYRIFKYHRDPDEPIKSE